MKNELRTLVLTFVALMILTVLTVAVAYVDLRGFNVTVALGIAGLKAALVTVYFMHVRRSSTLVSATIVAGVLWLAVLIGMTMSDFTTRAW